ncbi:hypothetical protein ABW20_dc0110134 [Dactylellina cionopaga]|nr:hypothetical protein ABW20_dc0110134 [Dactylellina cionopaga]
MIANQNLRNQLNQNAMNSPPIIRQGPPMGNSPTYDIGGETTRVINIPQMVAWRQDKYRNKDHTALLKWQFKRNVISDIAFMHACGFWIGFLAAFAYVTSQFNAGNIDRAGHWTQASNCWILGMCVLAALLVTTMIEVSRPKVMRVLMVLRHEEEIGRWGRLWPFFSIGMTKIYPVIVLAMASSIFGMTAYLYKTEHDAYRTAMGDRYPSVSATTSTAVVAATTAAVAIKTLIA